MVDVKQAREHAKVACGIPVACLCTGKCSAIAMSSLHTLLLSKQWTNNTAVCRQDSELETATITSLAEHPSVQSYKLALLQKRVFTHNSRRLLLGT